MDIAFYNAIGQNIDAFLVETADNIALECAAHISSLQTAAGFCRETAQTVYNGGHNLENENVNVLAVPLICVLSSLCAVNMGNIGSDCVPLTYSLSLYAVHMVDIGSDCVFQMDSFDSFHSIDAIPRMDFDIGCDDHDDGNDPVFPDLYLDVAAVIWNYFRCSTSC